MSQGHLNVCEDGTVTIVAMLPQLGHTGQQVSWSLKPGTNTNRILPYYNKLHGGLASDGAVK